MSQPVRFTSHEAVSILEHSSESRLTLRVEVASALGGGAGRALRHQVPMCSPRRRRRGKEAQFERSWVFWTVLHRTRFRTSANFCLAW